MSVNNKRILLALLLIIVITAALAGIFFGKKIIVYFRTWTSGRNGAVFAYLREPERFPEWKLEALTTCDGAPFLLPTRGYIGYLYNDSFSPLKLHTGLDIFGGEECGVTPIYAPYDGFLTREKGWKSSLILRIPQDPLQPNRQIWVYMTHMADSDGNSLIESAYPDGVSEIPVRQGDLLGFQGNYSGNPARPTGIHLHISIVKDDGYGNYLNELRIENTLDPSRYFGMTLNASDAVNVFPACGADR